jgi:hypothetical protein
MADSGLSRLCHIGAPIGDSQLIPPSRPITRTAGFLLYSLYQCGVCRLFT